MPGAHPDDGYTPRGYALLRPWSIRATTTPVATLRSIAIRRCGPVQAGVPSPAPENAPGNGGEFLLL
ncbi:hypothetical protein [Phytoactinopolyspora halotolerans]|uniref:Uncharacterized protein n=1 Tax=Phytoactinopolyspora halotolerans TaxID=1981512 RepID=A0A6L9SHV8_9ACTN|nr:hypothetical protein [Phytoactinopolyspora halotolerans]NEE04224.1 hypothetical protein [Phytoactinopolyspora halotolerans]